MGSFYNSTDAWPHPRDSDSNALDSGLCMWSSKAPQATLACPQVNNLSGVYSSFVHWQEWFELSAQGQRLSGSEVYKKGRPRLLAAGQGQAFAYLQVPGEF